MTILPLLRSRGRLTVATVTYTSYLSAARIGNAEAMRLPPELANDFIGDLGPLNVHADELAVWLIEVVSLPTVTPRADDFITVADGTVYTVFKITGPLRMRNTDFYVMVTRSTP